MSKQIVNLKDLMIEQGQERYDALKQEQKELPEIQRRVSNKKLKDIISRQLKTTRKQSERIMQSYKTLGTKPEGQKSECCNSIFRQTRDVLERAKDPEIRDSAIINSIQRLNHDKIAGYGSLSSFAREIGEEKLAGSFHESLLEEKAFDEELSGLAESEVNKKAVKAMVH